MKRYKRLEETDRASIQVLTTRGYSDAEIAREIGVHRATIGRERKRNTVDGKYYYHLAQNQAEKRQKEKRRRRTRVTRDVVALVEDKLRIGWSPQQISGWLKYRQKDIPCISHERIYQHVWRNKLEGGKLYLHLRRRGRRYRYFR